jgi:multicomponent K+:H+ antiporter subunit A
MLLAILLPSCIAAFLLPWFRRPGAAFAVAQLVTLASFAAVLMAAPGVLSGEVPRLSVAWLPALGARFTLRLDGLALMFAGLISGIGALVVLYARYYLEGDARLPRFYGCLLGFMGAMLGVVLAGDLVLIAFFWELTSLASFLLIAFDAPERGALRGARVSLAITAAGGLALMVGVALLGQIAGSFDLDRVIAAASAIRADARYPAVLGCVLFAAFTKSAQFPFHFWLPRAMAAPTPVSAYLHSATLVKAGIFLLLRLYPVLSGTEAWFLWVAGIGAATLLLGGVFALLQHDLKSLLAYSTVSHLGLIVLLIGLESATSTVAAVFHVMNHATFKASLFMAAGIVDHECGTRDLRRVGGLMRFLPLTGVLAITAAGAMAGVPLLNGFLSKEMFFAESLAIEGNALYGALAPWVAVAAGAAGVAYSSRFVHDVFFNGPAQGLDRTPHEPPFWMRVPVAILVLICIAVGLFPEPLIGRLLAAASGATLAAPLPDYSLHLWHGFTLPLAMSGLALVLGVGTYAVLMRRRKLHRIDTPSAHGYLLFERLQLAAARLGREAGRRLRGERLNWQMAALAVVAIAACVWPLVSTGITATRPDWHAVPEPLAVALWLIGAACTLAVIGDRFQPVTRLLFLGAVGLVIALSFAGLSAPDLALTQLFIEVASVLLLLLALERLPIEPGPARAGTHTFARALVAAAGGLGLGWLAWEAMQRRPDRISAFHLAQALPGGGGTNAVNVIIVDFRGFDTLGEVMVLGAAALIVLAFLARERDEGLARRLKDSFMLPVVIRPLLPFCALVSAYLYLRGHNLPGGGFVAGLLLAIALVLEALSLNRWRAPHARPVLWLAGGLTIALVTGCASLVLGYPFLTSAHGHPHLPLVGEVPLASAALFDLGVVGTVLGATIILILAFAFGADSQREEAGR